MRKLKRCIRHCTLNTQSLPPKVDKYGYANPYTFSSMLMWWTYK